MERPQELKEFDDRQLLLRFVKYLYSEGLLFPGDIVDKDNWEYHVVLDYQMYLEGKDESPNLWFLPGVKTKE